MFKIVLWTHTQPCIYIFKGTFTYIVYVAYFYLNFQVILKITHVPFAQKWGPGIAGYSSEARWLLSFSGSHCCPDWPSKETVAWRHWQRAQLDIWILLGWLAFKLCFKTRLEWLGKAGCHIVPMVILLFIIIIIIIIIMTAINYWGWMGVCLCVCVLQNPRQMVFRTWWDNNTKLQRAKLGAAKKTLLKINGQNDQRWLIRHQVAKVLFTRG